MVRSLREGNVPTAARGDTSLASKPEAAKQAMMRGETTRRRKWALCA